jgi:hypothetical protein
VIDPELDRFLDHLERALGGLRRRERARALREARDHLLCAADEREARGGGRDESVRSAIEAFGAVESIAAGYTRPARSRVEMVSAVAVVVLLALAIAPPGGSLGQIMLPTSHAAVSDPAPPPSCTAVFHDARGALVLDLGAGQHERNKYCAMHSMMSP